MPGGYPGVLECGALGCDVLGHLGKQWPAELTTQKLVLMKYFQIC
jgi:hypothetical protein